MTLWLHFIITRWFYLCIISNSLIYFIMTSILRCFCFSFYFYFRGLLNLIFFKLFIYFFFKLPSSFHYRSFDFPIILFHFFSSLILLTKLRKRIILINRESKASSGDIIIYFFGPP